MLINFYKLCSCKVHHSNHYHSSNKSFDLCVLCVVPTLWAVTFQGRTLLVVQVNEPPALSPQLQMFSGEGTTSPPHSASLCSASGYTVFLQNHLCCGGFLELQVSTLLQTPCRCVFLLATEALRWLSVSNSDTGNASRAGSWMWLCRGLQVEVVASGSRPTMARADQASESSGCGESIPVGVDGGCADQKPGKALLYVF